MDLNHYHSNEKTNITYNVASNILYESQDNFNSHKNKNSFSLKDFRKIKKAFSQKGTKKNSYKKNNDQNFLKEKYFNKVHNDAQNISFKDNKLQFTEPSCNEFNSKNSEKINYYCIKKIKEEMNEILKNKKNVNNYSNVNINTNGNVIDNSLNNKMKLPFGYNYYNKNKVNYINNMNGNIYVNRKNSQNKTPKNMKAQNNSNLTKILVSDNYKDPRYKINYAFGNNSKVSPNNKNTKISGKFSTNNLYNNISDNNSMNVNKQKDMQNKTNHSALKNVKKNKIRNNNINSRSYYKIMNSKANISNNSQKKNTKRKKRFIQ